MTHTVTETWYQNTTDTDLWYDNSGLLVNEPALNEREAYFDVIRIPASGVPNVGLTNTTYA